MSLAFFAGLLTGNLIGFLLRLQQSGMLQDEAKLLLLMTKGAALASMLALPGFLLAGLRSGIRPNRANLTLSAGLGLCLALFSFLLFGAYWMQFMLLGGLPCGLMVRWLEPRPMLPGGIPVPAVTNAEVMIATAPSIPSPPSAAERAQAPRRAEPEAEPAFSLLPWSIEALTVARQHAGVLLPAALALALVQFLALRMADWVTAFQGDEITTLLALMPARLLQLLAGASFVVLVLRRMVQPAPAPEPPARLKQVLAEGSLALLAALSIGMIATAAVSQLLYGLIWTLAPGAESLSRQMLELGPVMLRTHPFLACLIGVAALPPLLYVGNAAALALGDVALRSRRALPAFAQALERLWPYRYEHVMPAYALGLAPLALAALLNGLDERGAIGLMLLVQVCVYAWGAGYILALSRGVQRLEMFGADADR